MRTIRLVCVLFLVSLILGGCASRPQPQVQWINRNVPPHDWSRQFQIDQGECLALAAQAVPMPQGVPQVNVPQQPRPQGYTSTYRGYSSDGTYHSGRIETTPQNQGWQPQGFLAGAERARQQRAQEEALAMQLAPYAMQIRAQRGYAESCMLRRGWETIQTYPGR